MSTTKQKELRAHRRKQLKRNAAVREAALLINKALSVLAKHDMSGLSFTRSADGKFVRLEARDAKTRYEPPPRVKLDPENLPPEMRLSGWTQESPLRHTRPAPNGRGGKWEIYNGYALTLTRIDTGLPPYRVGGSFRSWTSIMRRAYEVDCAEATKVARTKHTRRAA
jgi:hypothetical protein